jgi:ABC-type glycerol-3-phosphate transport system permease component
MQAMNPLGYVARALLILAGALAGFAVVSFASMGYRGMALLFLVTVMIPVSMIVYEYMTGPMK